MSSNILCKYPADVLGTSKFPRNLISGRFYNTKDQGFQLLQVSVANCKIYAEAVPGIAMTIF